MLRFLSLNTPPVSLDGKTRPIIIKVDCIQYFNASNDGRSSWIKVEGCEPLHVQETCAQIVGLLERITED